MLAIVIPYYKISFFRETLESIERQTNKNFKVYIGNDASPENPDSIIADYEPRLNITYKIFSKNLGSSSLTQQWHRCVEMIEDEKWVMILGDDDELSANCVDDFYKNIKEIEFNGCNVVRFASHLHDVSNNEFSAQFTHPTIEKATDFFYRRFTGKTRSSLSEYIFRKSALEFHGFKDHELGWYADDRAVLEFSEFGNIYSINSSYAVIKFSDKNISRWNYKTAVKQDVTFKFFTFIIKNHYYKFSKAQRKDLLRFYEGLVYRYRKVSFSSWKTAIPYFVADLFLKQGMKFTFKCILRSAKPLNIRKVFT